jgi:hypothetical protein
MLGVAIAIGSAGSRLRFDIETRRRSSNSSGGLVDFAGQISPNRLTYGE